MAQYQIGNQVYEVPDNLPPQQLQQILEQLATGQQPRDPRGAFASALTSLDAPLENMATTARLNGAEGTADTLAD